MGTEEEEITKLKKSYDARRAELQAKCSKCTIGSGSASVDRCYDCSTGRAFEILDHDPIYSKLPQHWDSETYRKHVWGKEDEKIDEK